MFLCPYYIQIPLSRSACTRTIVKYPFGKMAPKKYDKDDVDILFSMLMNGHNAHAMSSITNIPICTISSWQRKGI